MIKITFFQDPIQRIILLSKFKANPTLKRILVRNQDITKQIDKTIQYRLKGMIENFFTMYISGFQGSFKTSLGMTIAQENDAGFNCERINFEYEPYRESLKNSNPKEIRQLDEMVFTRGTGANRLIQEIQETIETLRKRQNSLIIASPDKKYFDDKLFTFFLETIDTALLGTCKFNKKKHEVRLCKCYYDEKNPPIILKCYVRSALKHDDKYLGLYIKEIQWGNPLFKEYNTRKSLFMQEIVEGKKSRANYETIATEIMNSQDTSQYKNKKQLTLLIQRLKPNLTIGETDLVITSILMQRNENKA